MVYSKSTWFYVRPAVRMLLSLFILGGVLGCLPPSGKSFSSSQQRYERDPLQSARLNTFLVLADPQAPGLRMTVSKLEILSDDLWLPLLDKPLVFDSAKLGAGQLFLGGRSVLPGIYHRLRITVDKGEAQNSTGEYVEIVSEPFQVEIDLTVPLAVALDDSPSLLLTWDVGNSLLSGNKLQPVLVMDPTPKQMLLDLVFVSCPSIDTIFVVRVDKNWVVDSFGLRGGPTFLAVDPVASNKRLFVLASRDRMVKIVDLSSFRIVDFYPVPLNDSPTFMTISPDGRNAFLLDERSGYLSLMDLDSGQLSNRVFLDFRPSYALYMEKQQQLAVSQALSQRVLLLNPQSLKVAGSISTGSSPQGLLVADDQLYIVENGGNSVLITDLNSGGGQSRLPVGFGPRRLLASDNQIYVNNYLDGSLSVFLPGQLGVTQEIFGLGRPKEMVLDQFFRRLYITDEEADSLIVIDTNANRIIERIKLGANPFGLAVIQ